MPILEAISEFDIRIDRKRKLSDMLDLVLDTLRDLVPENDDVTDYGFRVW